MLPIVEGPELDSPSSWDSAPFDACRFLSSIFYV